MSRRKKRILIGVVVLAFLGGMPLIGISFAKHRIESASVGRVFTDSAEVPERKVGLVLGCVPFLADGRPNLYFRFRIDAAVELYEQKKVRYFLVSGDNSRNDYDESTAMKDALIERGVPGDRIVCDYAGFRTLDSVVRAREVFLQDSLVVISQNFHVRRAIYIGQEHGVDLVGYVARDVVGTAGARTRYRESLARLKAVLDMELFGVGPKFLGEPVPIGR